MKHKIISLITIAIILLSAFILKSSEWLWPVLITIGILYLILIIYGAFTIQANYFLNSISHGKDGGLAFTFDDGPDPVTTPKILEILRAEKIKATFFIIGKRAEKYPEIVKAIDQEGHIVANHTYDHSNSIGFFLTGKLTTDFEKCSNVIEKITGKKPNLFRPPFGVTNPKFERALKKLNLTSIGWSGRSLDTITTNKITLLSRVRNAIKNGAILLFHDTQNVTLEALPEIIELCRKNGIKIVPLQELTNMEPYEK